MPVWAVHAWVDLNLLINIRNNAEYLSSQNLTSLIGRLCSGIPKWNVRGILFRSPIWRINEYPATHYFTGISRNTQSKSYMLSLAERVWEFRSHALRDTLLYIGFCCLWFNYLFVLRWLIQRRVISITVRIWRPRNPQRHFYFCITRRLMSCGYSDCYNLQGIIKELANSNNRLENFGLDVRAAPSLF